MFICYYDFIPVIHSLLGLHQHPIACRYIDTTYIVLANDQYIVQNLTLINLTGIPGFPCCPGSPFSPYKYKYVCVYNVTLRLCICICSLVHVIQLILSPGPPSLLKLRARACMLEDEAACSYILLTFIPGGPRNPGTPFRPGVPSSPIGPCGPLSPYDIIL